MSTDESIKNLRLEKVYRLMQLGLDPYKLEYWQNDFSVADLISIFEENKKVSLAGRVVSYRNMGKAGFAHISDGENNIQAYFREDALGEKLWEAYGLLDLGDHIGVEGEFFTTKTGEKSVKVRNFSPLSKCFHNLPTGKEKDGHVFSGLQDPEIKNRHRHLDLLADKESRARFINRSKIISSVRNYFESKDFLEVETPLLQKEAGGAASKPFLTHYNEYELDAKLRISLELPLKRVICGDIPKVFEIGRVFRNEGVSYKHNPEFTLLEFYESYTSLEDMMWHVEGLFKHVAKRVFGTTVVDIPHEDGYVTIDFAQPWKKLDMTEAIAKHTGLYQDQLQDFETAKQALEEISLINPVTGKSVCLENETTLGGLLEKLLEVFVEPTLIEPTFIGNYPIDCSPLAKKNRLVPNFARRFEGYVLTTEICNAFGEINDPFDQRRRFEAQGDTPLDEEFLYALECGMPPTAGCGIGIDRMVMMLTGARTLRDVLLFPFMRS